MLSLTRTPEHAVTSTTISASLKVLLGNAPAPVVLDEPVLMEDDHIDGAYAPRGVAEGPPPPPGNVNVDTLVLTPLAWISDAVQCLFGLQ